MEHDTIQLIRRKVRDVESRPVSWNQDRVWHMIRVKAEPKSRKRLMYYAAAVLIAISFFYYMIPSHQQKQTEVKADASESTHSKELIEQQQIKRPAATIDKTNLTKIIQRPVHSLPTKLLPTPVAVNGIPVPEVINDPLIATSAENRAVVRPSESREIVSEQGPVQVIIGVIPKQSTPVAVQKVKRTKFHLFRSPEKEGGTFADEESQMLSARIN
jgi:hypothetical protein